MYSSGYCCQILIKFKFSQQIFKKFSNIKFHENPSSGSRVVPCGQTDGQMDRHVETSRNFAKEPEN
jgi:hypothetical protein